MRPEKISFDYYENIPGIPQRRHIPALKALFAAEDDVYIATARDTLFRTLERRGVKKSSQNYLFELASVANWLHRDEPRITGEPFVTHPLAVARIIVDNPYIPVKEIEHNVAKAIGHDLSENTDITDGELEEFAKPAHAKGILLLSNVIKSKMGDRKLERTEYFKRIFDEGDFADLRVKIADWIHNLRTTPKSTDGYLQEKWNKISRLQTKFGLTSDLILPFIRDFPKGEREYWDALLRATYDEYKPDGSQDLKSLIEAA